MTTLKMVLLSGALAVLTACGGEAEQTADVQGSALDSAMPMGGMPGMEGMSMDPAMIGQMESHLERMSGLSADSMVAMRAEHRRMAGNMLALMNQEMRDMGMPTDSAWTATLDSIRGDLTRMPEMSGAEMQSLMPDHRRRMGRLMASHEAMMAQMGH